MSTELQFYLRKKCCLELPRKSRGYKAYTNMYSKVRICFYSLLIYIFYSWQSIHKWWMCLSSKMFKSLSRVMNFHESVIQKMCGDIWKLLRQKVQKCKNIVYYYSALLLYIHFFYKIMIQERKVYYKIKLSTMFTSCQFGKLHNIATS